MFDEYPCNTCELRDMCDGWEAQFCCERCRFLFGDDDPPCDTCDPMDI